MNIEDLSNAVLEKELVVSARVLSSVMTLNKTPNNPPIRPYKRFSKVKWALSSKNNYLKLYERFNALCEEYYYRYGRTHKYQQFDVNFTLGLYYYNDFIQSESSNSLVQ